MVDLVGVELVHMEHPTTVVIRARKHDNTGWWIVGGGGLCDRVIDRGDWRPLAIVLAEHRRWSDLWRIVSAAANEGRNFDPDLTDDEASAVERFALRLESIAPPLAARPE